MKIFATAHTHLSLGMPDKGMERFSETGRDHPQQIEAAWRELVSDDDLVLISGDISWAMWIDCAHPDIAFLGACPAQR